MITFLSESPLQTVVCGGVCVIVLYVLCYSMVCSQLFFFLLGNGVNLLE